MELKDAIHEGLSIFYKPSNTYMWYHRKQRAIKRLLIGVSFLAVLLLIIGIFFSKMLWIGGFLWIMVSISQMIKLRLEYVNLSKLKEASAYILKHTGRVVDEKELVDTGVVVYIANRMMR